MPQKKTKTGFSTDAASLEKLQGQHPIIDHLLAYREVEKLRSTYGDGLLQEVGPDDRIHATFNQTVARTGRLSSDQPNLHNIPVRSDLGREFRKAFVPAKGSKLLVADYNQIELRCIAHLAEDPGLIDSFESRRDIHTETASRRPRVRAISSRADHASPYGRELRHRSIVGPRADKAAWWINRSGKRRQQRHHGYREDSGAGPASAGRAGGGAPAHRTARGRHSLYRGGVRLGRRSGGAPRPLPKRVGAAERLKGSERVLVVDDNADMRRYLRRILHEHWKVDVANDGVSALEKVRKSPPDLVIADLMMPGARRVISAGRPARRPPASRRSP